MVFTREQFTEIYNDHVEKIYRFCYLKVGSKDEAEDLSSEVFLKFIQYVKETRKDITNVRAFLYRTARNLVIDYYRTKEKKPLPLDTDWLKEDEMPQLESPEKRLVLNDDIQEISQALGKIKEDYADLVIWHYLEGLSIPEISQINGKSQGANRVTLHRALGVLREELPTGV